MYSLLLPNIAAAKKSRVIMVGSVTGNDNTVGGGGVYPVADLRELKGLEAGATAPIAMVDGYNFNGAKVNYKIYISDKFLLDSHICYSPFRHTRTARCVS